MKNKIYLQTTQIGTNKTVSQIQKLLGENGASAVLINYEKSEPVTISFKLAIEKQEIPFKLPCRWLALFSLINNHDEQKAKRIAWRQIFYWLKSQFALIQTGMVEPTEVFLPYMQTKKGKTFFEHLKDDKKLLEFKEQSE